MDIISRQDAIDVLSLGKEILSRVLDDIDVVGTDREKYSWGLKLIESNIEDIKELPSAQPEPSEITDEQAILHLQSTGWIQRHDKEMYESGLREQLADDSGSYDSLIPCEDAISRQAAYDAIRPLQTYKLSEDDDMLLVDKAEVQTELMMLPSAQPEPEQNTMPEQLKMNGFGVKTGKTCTDAISRQAAIDALDNIKIPRNASWYPYYQQALTAMSRLPSAYPETDGFCTDCKEYDQERHFCPRFDRVIKRMVEEMGIIHCKDCRHWDKTWTNDWAKDYHYCPMVDGVRKASFYCADAEKRDV